VPETLPVRNYREPYELFGCVAAKGRAGGTSVRPLRPFSVAPIKALDNAKWDLLFLPLFVYAG
jgi:hypothetical protein